MKQSTRFLGYYVLFFFVVCVFWSVITLSFVGLTVWSFDRALLYLLVGHVMSQVATKAAKDYMEDRP